MTLKQLIEWREKFAKVDGTNEMKKVALQFQQENNLGALLGWQIYDLLREEKVSINLLVTIGIE